MDTKPSTKDLLKQRTLYYESADGEVYDEVSYQELFEFLSAVHHFKTPDQFKPFSAKHPYIYLFPVELLNDRIKIPKYRFVKDGEHIKLFNFIKK